jgi:membrane protease subunit (stomatin/prohibitin family)
MLLTDPDARANHTQCGKVARSAVAVVVLLASAGPAKATDLLYSLMSPNLGGNNPAALATEQLTKSLQAQHAAAQAAAARAATTDPTQQFQNAIISQLTGLVAQNIAQKISGSKNGDAGVIRSGNVSVSYVNSDGQLSVTITTPTGSTSVSLPSGN